MVQEGGEASAAPDLAEAQSRLRTGSITADETIEADTVAVGYVYIADPAQATPDDVRQEIARLRRQIEELLSQGTAANQGDAEDARDAMRKADESIARATASARRVNWKRRAARLPG